MSGCYVKIYSSEAPWNSGATFEGGNLGHRPRIKGGYFPVPPVDSLQDIRTAMCLALEELGLKVEVHHHEVATAGQCEIGIKFDTLVKKADGLQILKYAIHNVAHAYGKTATFMPKPSSATTAPACTCTSRCGRTARTSSPATATAASPKSRSTTSAASSSTPRR